MTSIAAITALSQAVYLQTHGITNDVTGTDLDSFLNQNIIWGNMFASELELAADWKYLRTNNNQIGTISANTLTYQLDPSIRKPIYHPQRLLTIQQDGVVVSKWTLVDPDQIQNVRYPYTPQYAMFDNDMLTFSRLPKDYEVGGIIVADTIQWMPQLSLTNATLINIVTPPKILVLGIAKDSLPPDLVRGGLATLMEMRYNKLLGSAIQDNGGTSLSDESMPDDLSFVGGDYLNG